MGALPSLPFGLRYIAMKLRTDLQEKFPSVAEDELIKVCSTWMPLLVFGEPSRKLWLFLRRHRNAFIPSGKKVCDITGEAVTSAAIPPWSCPHSRVFSNHFLQIVGNLLYYRYVNPAIIAPEMFDIVEVDPSQEVRRALANVAFSRG